MKRDFKIAAALNIGPEYVQMKIAQSQNQDDVVMLDELKQPTVLGEESFNQSNIHFDTVETVSETLNNYYALAKEYDIPIEYVSTVATTALRNAQNKDYVIDQIKVKTQRDINVLEDAEEKSLIFREMLRKSKNIIDKQKTQLMVYTGTDSVGIALVYKSQIIYAQNVKTDTLRLTKMTEDIVSLTMGDFIQVIDEYLNYIMTPIYKHLNKNKINTLIAGGDAIDLIAKMCQGKNIDQYRTITKKSMITVYRDVSEKSAQHLEKTFLLPYEKSKNLLIMMAFYIKLISFTDVSIIYNIQTSLVDALLYNMLYKKQARTNKRTFDLNMVSSARFLAKKYDYDQKHSKTVEGFALTIFDNLKKVHGFSRRERLYLQTAAILHDIGKYVDATACDSATVGLITKATLISLNTAQKEIIANIARYHGNEAPSAKHTSYNRLSGNQKIIVSKLSAILKLADAIDYARLQKIKSIRLQLHEKRLTVIAESSVDTTLEEWMFKRQSEFFEQVFGIKCDIIKKGMI